MKLRLFLNLGLSICLLFLYVTPVSAAPLQVMRGHVPAAVARLQPTGNFARSNQLNLAIGLPLRNKEALTNLLRKIYDPASPNYHHYLTPEQFTEQFGPTEQDYQAVIAFMESKGLRVTDKHPNRVVLDVKGSVAEIEKAFHVALQVYLHPTEKRTFYAPDAEPSLDLTIPILHISGLDNYAIPRPTNLKIKSAGGTANATPNPGTGPGGSYWGYDFRAAYAPGVTLDGTGQTIGLVEFDGYYTNDITSYESQTGLPNVTLTNVPIDGGVSTIGGDVGEVSLDIEMAIAMAPGISRVMVYEAPNPSPFVDMLSGMANDNQAKQLSCSWYIPGGGPDLTADQIFQQMAAQGQSFFQASGDYDAYTGPIDFPCDNPYITQVGGTTLGPGGSDSRSRGYHTATLLTNGLVLVAGGVCFSGGVLNTAELYDPVTGEWTRTGSLNAARGWHTATLLTNGLVLVTGGGGNTNILSSAELYDPATGTWTPTGSMADAREGFTATLLTNGLVLVAGGGNSNGILTSAELYDPGTGTWTPTGSMTAESYLQTATLLTNGLVLVAGGMGSGEDDYSGEELYNPSNGTWTPTGTLNFPREGHTATLLTNGQVLVAGGYNWGTYLTNAELYDPCAGTWTLTGSTEIVRYGHTATLLTNGQVLVAGGMYEKLISPPNGYEDILLFSAESYDPAAGTWTPTGSMTDGRWNYTATLLTNGQVLAVGSWGLFFTPSLSSAELYQPSTGTWTNTGAMGAPVGPWLENTWNWGKIGSGGGISTYYPIPSWQTNLNMTTNQGSTTMRNVPDVAMVADDIYVVYNDGSSGAFAGTSCAAPLWAGFTALVNQQAVTAGRPSVGFINPSVYAIGKGTNYTDEFHDITTGDNTWTGSPNNFYAVPGYDLCTGWGTPAGQNLIDGLSGVHVVGILALMPTNGFTATRTYGSPFDVTAQNFELSNTGLESLAWTLVNTSSWLQVSSAGGTLAVGGQTNLTISLNSNAFNILAGNFTANIRFTDQTHGVVQYRQFNLSISSIVITQLVQNGGFETGDFTGWSRSGYTNYLHVFHNQPLVPPHSGLCVAGANAPAAYGSLSQTLPTVVGQTYLLSLWLECTTNPFPPYLETPNEFSVNWGGINLFDESDIGMMEWTNLQFVVTATTTNTDLNFAFMDQPWYFGLDDVVVVPGTLPAFQSITQSNNTVWLNWETLAGFQYQVQYRTNLTQGSWINCGGPVITATNAIMTCPDAIGTDPQRFYRVQWVPPD